VALTWVVILTLAVIGGSAANTADGLGTGISVAVAIIAVLHAILIGSNRP
jgi:hypothetical protein